MTDIYDVQSINGLISFVVWSLVTLGVSKILFGSWHTLEIVAWLTGRTHEKRGEGRQLQWELHSGLRYSQELAKGDPHAARIKLTEDELRERSERLKVLNKVSWWLRMTMYFMNCSFCQCFWGAVLLWAVTNGADLPMHWLLSAIAYAVGGGLCGNYFSRSSNWHFNGGGGGGQPPSSSGRGCPSCGH